MSAKKLILGGLFVGSTIGGMIPSMWGGDMLSVSGFVFSIIVGIAGAWGGYRLAKSI